MRSLCVNCSLAFRMSKKTAASALDVQSKLLLEEWVEQSVTEDDLVCLQCISLLEESVNNGDRSRKLGHMQVCHGCGVSVLRKRYKQLPPDHPVAQTAILWNPRRKIEAAIVCRGCNMRIQRLIDAENGIERNKKSSISEQIIIANVGDANESCLRNRIYEKVPVTIDSNQNSTLKQENKADELDRVSLFRYKRVAKGRQNCVMPHCKNNKMKPFPTSVVERLLVDHNLYVPHHIRICTAHLENADWESLAQELNVTGVFSREHVERAFDTLKRRKDSSVDFEYVEYMPDSLCKFLTGLSVTEFIELHTSIKWKVVKSKLALAILLIKLKREQNEDVIGELLGVTGSVVRAELLSAIKCVCATDKTFFSNILEEKLSRKLNASFLSVYATNKVDML